MEQIWAKLLESALTQGPFAAVVVGLGLLALRQYMQALETVRRLAEEVQRKMADDSAKSAKHLEALEEIARDLATEIRSRRRS